MENQEKTLDSYAIITRVFKHIYRGAFVCTCGQECDSNLSSWMKILTWKGLNLRLMH